MMGDKAERLRDLISQYFDLGYAEGATGRDADTMAGHAQSVWSEIDSLINGIAEQLDESRAMAIEYQRQRNGNFNRAKAAEREAGKLREALTWYGDPANWRDTPINHDRGNRARATLSDNPERVSP